jgi:hypothetical protein
MHPMMTISLVLLLTVPSSIAHADQEGLPADVRRLAEQRAAAIASIDGKYVLEFEALQKKYLREGNLQAANAITHLIEQIQAQHEPPGEEPIEEFLAGEWNVRFLKGDEPSGNPRAFTDSHLVSGSERFRWRFEDGVVHVDMGGGRWEKLQVNR